MRLFLRMPPSGIRIIEYEIVVHLQHQTFVQKMNFVRFFIVPTLNG